MRKRIREQYPIPNLWHNSIRIIIKHVFIFWLMFRSSVRVVQPDRAIEPSARTVCADHPRAHEFCQGYELVCI